MTNQNITPENYIQHAMRTNSDTVGTYNVHPDLIHGALGLADELIELRQALDKCDRVNALEELSDCAWFTALIASHVGHNPFDIVLCPYIYCIDPVSDIEYNIGNIISAVKRSYAYGKQLPDDLYTMLEALVESIDHAAQKLGSSLEAVLQLNINKLSARYPDRFTPELANNRDAERERVVLESGV